MTATAVDEGSAPVERGRGRIRVPLTVVLAALVIVIVALMVLMPQIAPRDPELIDTGQSLHGASWQHLFGTDQLGRDVFSRVIEGARTAVIAPLVLAMGGVALGVGLGVMAGLVGGWIDTAVSRLVDVLYSIPGLVVAIVLVGVTEGGLYMAVAVLMLFGLPMNVRIFRAAVLERVGLPYMEAARTVGLSQPRIVFTQLLPALVPLMVTTFFVQFTYGLLAVSSLSFLGLGVEPGAADWGRMVYENRSSLELNVWATAGPAIVLAALSVSANIVGDWIHDEHEMAAKRR